MIRIQGVKGQGFEDSSEMLKNYRDRKKTAEYLRSLYIAYGSVCELETQVLLFSSRYRAEPYNEN